MELMTIKDYAESRNITYEAVRKQVRQYKKSDLKGHLNYQGKLTFLDEYAVDFLDKHRQKRNARLAPTDEEVQRDIRKLQYDLQMALQEVNNLKSQVITLQSEKIELIEDRAKYTALLEEKETMTTLQNHLQQELERSRMENEHKQQELDKYKPTLFGLYRKTE